ncbi:MAG: type II and III secretion system protein family protein [Novosphingobium sp.]|nr:type II and III secretion system protein family protein [Novosphingobium sp.]
MKSTLSALALAAAPLALAATASEAHAQYNDAALHAGALEVPVNKSQVVTADKAISKALVGNAEIADVLPISDRSVYVLGKQLGTTSLTLYDRSNRVLAVMDIAVGPDVDGVRQQLASLVPGQNIDARISNGSILLSGMVSDPGAADRAAQIAKAYAGDSVINLISVGSSQQVMLEVRFAEVNRNIGEQLGVSGFGVSKGGSFRGAIGEGATYSGGTQDTVTSTIDSNGNVTSSVVSGTPPNLALGAISGTFGIFSKVFNIGDVDIEGVLNVLERKGLSKTLAEPTLLALSGETASFLAGGEFPIPVLQGNNNGTGSGGNGITVEFKPFGVSLGFTPTVLGDKVINLVLEPEVSSIDPSASITVNGLVVPGLQTRRASTTVELRDGESFAIAGLLRKDFQTTVRQLPILGSLPIIGSLFRSSAFNKGETELLIVVTPHLVQPLRPDQVKLPTDRVKDPDAMETLLNGDDYQTRDLPPSAPATDGAAAGGEAAEKGADYEY